jgi:hypothetical protein
MPGMRVREFAEADWPQVWPIVREVVQAAETFTYDPDMTVSDAHQIWVEVPPGLTVVAMAGDRVLGTAKMGTNRPGARFACIDSKLPGRCGRARPGGGY